MFRGETLHCLVCVCVCVFNNPSGRRRKKQSDEHVCVFLKQVTFWECRHLEDDVSHSRVIVKLLVLHQRLCLLKERTFPME